MKLARLRVMMHDSITISLGIMVVKIYLCKRTFSYFGHFIFITHSTVIYESIITIFIIIIITVTAIFIYHSYRFIHLSLILPLKISILCASFLNESYFYHFSLVQLSQLNNFYQKYIQKSLTNQLIPSKYDYFAIKIQIILFIGHLVLNYLIRLFHYLFILINIVFIYLIIVLNFIDSIIVLTL